MTRTRYYPRERLRQILSSGRDFTIIRMRLHSAPSHALTRALARVLRPDGCKVYVAINARVNLLYRSFLSLANADERRKRRRGETGKRNFQEFIRAALRARRAAADVQTGRGA